LEKIDPKGITMQIFASDIDSDAIENARKGVFVENIVADVTKKG
jgi:two-component system, chemotaxis family, CheB/CheR fusion protein